jgi:chromosome segregation ATPase
MLGKRNRSQAYTMGAVDHAVQTAMQSVTGQLERTEERLERVEGQHQECEANLANVRADLAEAKAEIDKLMSGRIAVPGEPAPKDRP